MNASTQELLPAEPQGLAVYNEFRARVAELQREEASLVFDYASKDGEKAARSHIYKLRQTKAPVDAARKAEKAASLEYGRKVDAEGNAIIDMIDAMIERHLCPLREQEQREAERVRTHRLIIDYILSIQGNASQPSEFLAAQCACLAAVVVDESLEEFRDEAAIAYAARSTELQHAYAAAVRREAEDAELAALRAEKLERDRSDREAKIAADAAAQATADAASAARREQAAAQAREAAANERIQRAEAEAKLATERAHRAAQDATEAAEREAKAAALRDEQNRLAREADIEHRRKVNNEVLADLIEKAGVSETTGVWVVKAIFSGWIRHVTLNY